jgi:hypothetical protein
MSNEFLQPTDELKRVAEELALLRRDLQTASSALGRIEKRLKATFPNFPTKKKEGKKPKALPTSDKMPDELNEIFETLVEATKSDGDSGFQRAVDDMDESILLAVAIELGVGTASSLTVPKAKKGIRSRVQESLQLQFRSKESRNKAVDSTATRVTPPADPSHRLGQESRHGQP